MKNRMDKDKLLSESKPVQYFVCIDSFFGESLKIVNSLKDSESDTFSIVNLQFIYIYVVFILPMIY